MILFTSGFPAAGKTTFAQKLTANLNKHVLHINPKDYYPDEFDKLPAEEQANIGITAWELSLEKMSKAICTLPNKALIIFDTCCSTLLSIQPLIMNAKLKGHNIYVVFIHAKLKDRQTRTKIDLASFEHKYIENFQNTLPRLKNLVCSGANQFYIFRNNNETGLKILNDGAFKLSNEIKSMRDK